MRDDFSFHWDRDSWCELLIHLVGKLELSPHTLGFLDLFLLDFDLDLFDLLLIQSNSSDHRKLRMLLEGNILFDFLLIFRR